MYMKMHIQYMYGQLLKQGKARQLCTCTYSPTQTCFLFFRFVCCVFCVLCVLEVLSVLLSNVSVARMLYTCFSMYMKMCMYVQLLRQGKERQLCTCTYSPTQTCLRGHCRDSSAPPPHACRISLSSRHPARSRMHR